MVTAFKLLTDHPSTCQRFWSSHHNNSISGWCFSIQDVSALLLDMMSDFLLYSGCIGYYAIDFGSYLTFSFSRESPFQGVAYRSWCRYMFSSLLGPTVPRKRVTDSLPQCRWDEAPWPQQHLPSGREALIPIGALSPSEVKAQFSISPHQCRVPPPTTSFHLVYAGWGWRLGSPWDLTGTEDKESGHGKREKAISLSARSPLSVVLLRSRWRLRSPQDPTDSTLLEELRSICFFLQGIDYKLPIRPTVSQQGNVVQSASTGQATEDGFPSESCWQYRVEGGEGTGEPSLPFPYGCLQKTTSSSVFLKPLDWRRGVTVA